MLATMITNYQSGEPGLANEEKLRRQIVFRHIAYLYQLREQLLEPTVWEHVSMKSSWGTGFYNRQRRAKLTSSFQEELEAIAGRKYLSAEEKTDLKGYKTKQYNY
jgi:putative membrane protein